MLEVISSILDAEKKADAIIKQADDKSKSLILSAESQSEGIKSNTIKKFKAERTAKITDAEVLACTEYNSIIEQGNLQANELKDGVTDKVPSVVDFVVDSIIK